jgi:hypothetical protein
MSQDQSITLTLTVDQANSVLQALETFSRLSIGQLQYLSDCVREGLIPNGIDATTPRQAADHQSTQSSTSDAHLAAFESFDHCLISAKQAIGLSAHGNFGISYDRVSIAGKRAYEISKVLSKAMLPLRLASIQDENVRKHFLHSVAGDGLTFRVTTDPAPIATLFEGDGQSHQPGM